MPATPTLRIGARVLLLDPNDHVLLIHADPDQPGYHWWELPGGGADPGEALADAACHDKHLPPNLPALLADVLDGTLRQPVLLHA